MDKKKFDMKNYADVHTEKTVKGNDGTEIIVRDHISFADKNVMANEMLGYVLGIHDDAFVYESGEYEKYKLYTIAKYYTDIDTDDVDPEIVADYLVNNGMDTGINEIVSRDYEYVNSIYLNLYAALCGIYENDSSITKALRTSFGFLFNGEDITESIAKAEAVKDTLYEAVSTWKQVEKEKEEKINNGMLSVGGNVINFAKKKE